jgi:hypothetical protein
MNDAFAPAIAALQADLSALDKKAREIKGAINVLCKHAGIDELYPNLETEAGPGSVTNIKADTFYGKTIGQAAREYLEMRKAGGLGPATPRDIYEALLKGGFQFETKVEANALVSLRNTMRKSSRIFHRLPNGQYGLLTWYPNAKSQRASDDDDDGEDETEGESTKPAANEESAAGPVSSDAPLNDQEEGASEPQEQEA